MSYALLSDDLLLQLEAAGVSRCARLLYVEGLVYCATALTDGEIRVRLTRFSDCDDVDACADELVQAGLWEDNRDSYRVLDYLDHQQSAAEVERKRADARRRAERSRRHRRGDHSLCTKSDFCPDGAVSPSSHARHTNGARDVRSPYQSNPILTDPDQREGEGKDKDGATASAPDGATASALQIDPGDLFDLTEILQKRGFDYEKLTPTRDGYPVLVLRDSQGKHLRIVKDKSGFHYWLPFPEDDSSLWQALNDALVDYDGRDLRPGTRLTVPLDALGQELSEIARQVHELHDTVAAVIDEWDKS